VRFDDFVVLARIILGFLAISPMSGYDLIRAFRTSAAHFWSADKAQIYRTLARLVADGHARTEVVPGTGAPDRVVHHLEASGRDLLIEWLASDQKPQAERDAFTAQIFFAESLTTGELRGILDARRAAAVDARDALRAVERSLPNADPTTQRGAWLRRKTLEQGIRAHEAHIEWLDDIRTGLGDAAT